MMTLLWDGALGIRKLLLRQRLHELAETNASAAIFLSIQQLGMRVSGHGWEDEDTLVPDLIKMLEGKAGRAG